MEVSWKCKIMTELGLNFEVISVISWCEHNFEMCCLVITKKLLDLYNDL